MSAGPRSALFIAEGQSDAPLADIVEVLMLNRGITVQLSTPDFSRLPRVKKDVASRLVAGLSLIGGPVDLVVVHRDADNAGRGARTAEIHEAVASATVTGSVLPVVPVRMTEAWLLLDDAAIRRVAGNPAGRTTLDLPKVHEVERVPDPKQLLRECLLAAADVTGRWIARDL